MKFAIQSKGQHAFIMVHSLIEPIPVYIVITACTLTSWRRWLMFSRCIDSTTTWRCAPCRWNDHISMPARCLSWECRRWNNRIGLISLTVLMFRWRLWKEGTSLDTSRWVYGCSGTWHEPWVCIIGWWGLHTGEAGGWAKSYFGDDNVAWMRRHLMPADCAVQAGGTGQTLDECRSRHASPRGLHGWRIER